jgi:hypothetical protein
VKRWYESLRSGGGPLVGFLVVNEGVKDKGL